MAHDVFISYSHNDKAIADAVCAKLEERKIRCWIAPRDIPPGATFADEIVDAIQEGKVLVLIWSSNTSQSSHILNELHQAFDQGVTVIPFRVEDVEPTKSLKYYIGRTHWLDALTPPLEDHMERLADTILSILGRAREPQAVASAAGGHALQTSLSPAAPAARKRSRVAADDFGSVTYPRRSRRIALFVCLGIALIGVIACFVLTRPDLYLIPGLLHGEDILQTSLQWPKVFEESFDSNSSGWTIGTSGNVHSTIEDGVLKVEIIGRNGYANLTVPHPAVSDFNLFVSARHSSGTNLLGYGIGFFQEANQLQYLFSIDDDGEYALRYWPSEGETVVAHGHFPYEPGRGYGIQLIALGSRMAFLVNGEILREISLEASGERVLALMAMLGSTSPPYAGTFEFDNVALRAP